MQFGRIGQLGWTGIGDWVDLDVNEARGQNPALTIDNPSSFCL